MTARSQQCSNGLGSATRLVSTIWVQSGSTSVSDKAEIKLGRGYDANLLSFTVKHL